MFLKIIKSDSTLEQKIADLKTFIATPAFIEELKNTNLFIKDTIAFAKKVLEKYSPVASLGSANDTRVFVIRLLLRLRYDQCRDSTTICEIQDMVCDIIQQENIFNRYLALRILYSIIDTPMEQTKYLGLIEEFFTRELGLTLYTDDLTKCELGFFVLSEVLQYMYEYEKRYRLDKCYGTVLRLLCKAIGAYYTTQGALERFKKHTKILAEYCAFSIKLLQFLNVVSLQASAHSTENILPYIPEICYSLTTHVPEECYDIRRQAISVVFRTILTRKELFTNIDRCFRSTEFNTTENVELQIHILDETMKFVTSIGKTYLYSFTLAMCEDFDLKIREFFLMAQGRNEPRLMVKCGEAFKFNLILGRALQLDASEAKGLAMRSIRNAHALVHRHPERTSVEYARAVVLTTASLSAKGRLLDAPEHRMLAELLLFPLAAMDGLSLREYCEAFRKLLPEDLDVVTRHAARALLTKLHGRYNEWAVLQESIVANFVLIEAAMKILQTQFERHSCLGSCHINDANNADDINDTGNLHGLTAQQMEVLFPIAYEFLKLDKKHIKNDLNDQFRFIYENMLRLEDEGSFRLLNKMYLDIKASETAYAGLYFVYNTFDIAVDELSSQYNVTGDMLYVECLLNIPVSLNLLITRHAQLLKTMKIGLNGSKRMREVALKYIEYIVEFDNTDGTMDEILVQIYRMLREGELSEETQGTVLNVLARISTKHREGLPLMYAESIRRDGEKRREIGGCGNMRYEIEGVEISVDLNVLVWDTVEKMDRDVVERGRDLPSHIFEYFRFLMKKNEFFTSLSRPPVVSECCSGEGGKSDVKNGPEKINYQNNAYSGCLNARCNEDDLRLAKRILLLSMNLLNANLLCNGAVDNAIMDNPVIDNPTVDGCQIARNALNWVFSLYKEKVLPLDHPLLCGVFNEAFVSAERISKLFFRKFLCLFAGTSHHTASNSMDSSMDSSMESSMESSMDSVIAGNVATDRENCENGESAKFISQRILEFSETIYSNDLMRAAKSLKGILFSLQFTKLNLLKASTALAIITAIKHIISAYSHRRIYLICRKILSIILQAPRYRPTFEKTFFSIQGTYAKLLYLEMELTFSLNPGLFIDQLDPDILKILANLSPQYLENTCIVQLADAFLKTIDKKNKLAIRCFCSFLRHTEPVKQLYEQLLVLLKKHLPAIAIVEGFVTPEEKRRFIDSVNRNWSHNIKGGALDVMRTLYTNKALPGPVRMSLIEGYSSPYKTIIYEIILNSSEYDVLAVDFLFSRLAENVEDERTAIETISDRISCAGAGKSGLVGYLMENLQMRYAYEVAVRVYDEKISKCCAKIMGEYYASNLSHQMPHDINAVLKAYNALKILSVHDEMVPDMNVLLLIYKDLQYDEEMAGIVNGYVPLMGEEDLYILYKLSRGFRVTNFLVLRKIKEIKNCVLREWILRSLDSLVIKRAPEVSGPGEEQPVEGLSEEDGGTEVSSETSDVPSLFLNSPESWSEQEEELSTESLRPQAVERPPRRAPEVPRALCSEPLPPGEEAAPQWTDGQALIKKIVSEASFFEDLGPSSILRMALRLNIRSEALAALAKNGLESLNNRAVAILYLCRFDPSTDLFSLIFKLSFHEMAGSLECLSLLIDHFGIEPFLSTVRSVFQSEMRYQTVRQIFLPLIYSKRWLVSYSEIQFELCVLLCRLFSKGEYNKDLYYLLEDQLTNTDNDNDSETNDNDDNDNNNDNNDVSGEMKNAMRNLIKELRDIVIQNTIKINLEIKWTEEAKKDFVHEVLSENNFDVMTYLINKQILKKIDLNLIRSSPRMGLNGELVAQLFSESNALMDREFLLETCNENRVLVLEHLVALNSRGPRGSENTGSLRNTRGAENKNDTGGSGTSGPHRSHQILDLCLFIFKLLAEANYEDTQKFSEIYGPFSLENPGLTATWLLEFMAAHPSPYLPLLSPVSQLVYSLEPGLAVPLALLRPSNLPDASFSTNIFHLFRNFEGLPFSSEFFSGLGSPSPHIRLSFVDLLLSRIPKSLYSSFEFVLLTDLKNSRAVELVLGFLVIRLLKPLESYRVGNAKILRYFTNSYNNAYNGAYNNAYNGAYSGVDENVRNTFNVSSENGGKNVPFYNNDSNLFLLELFHSSSSKFKFLRNLTKALLPSLDSSFISAIKKMLEISPNPQLKGIFDFEPNSASFYYGLMDWPMFYGKIKILPGIRETKIVAELCIERAQDRAVERIFEIFKGIEGKKISYKKQDVKILIDLLGMIYQENGCCTATAPPGALHPAQDRHLPESDVLFVDHPLPGCFFPSIFLKIKNLIDKIIRENLVPLTEKMLAEVRSIQAQLFSFLNTPLNAPSHPTFIFFMGLCAEILESSAIIRDEQGDSLYGRFKLWMSRYPETVSALCEWTVFMRWRVFIFNVAFNFVSDVDKKKISSELCKLYCMFANKAFKEGMYQKSMYILNEINGVMTIEAKQNLQKHLLDVECLYRMKNYTGVVNLVNSINIGRIVPEGRSLLYFWGYKALKRMGKEGEAAHYECMSKKMADVIENRKEDVKNLRERLVITKGFISSDNTGDNKSLRSVYNSKLIELINKLSLENSRIYVMEFIRNGGFESQHLIKPEFLFSFLPFLKEPLSFLGSQPVLKSSFIAIRILVDIYKQHNDNNDNSCNNNDNSCNNNGNINNNQCNNYDNDGNNDEELIFLESETVFPGEFIDFKQEPCQTSHISYIKKIDGTVFTIRCSDGSLRKFNVRPFLGASSLEDLVLCSKNAISNCLFSLFQSLSSEHELQKLSFSYKSSNDGDFSTLGSILRKSVFYFKNTGSGEMYEALDPGYIRGRKFVEIALKNRHLLFSYFRAKITDSSDFYSFRRTFINSFATTMALQIILGISDVSLENILIDENTGHCTLDCSDLVCKEEPVFYVRPNIEYFLGPEGVNGPFYMIVLQVLRSVLGSSECRNILEFYFGGRLVEKSFKRIAVKERVFCDLFDPKMGELFSPDLLMWI